MKEQNNFEWIGEHVQEFCFITSSLQVTLIQRFTAYSTVLYVLYETSIDSAGQCYKKNSCKSNTAVKATMDLITILQICNRNIVVSPIPVISCSYSLHPLGASFLTGFLKNIGYEITRVYHHFIVYT